MTEYADRHLKFLRDGYPIMKVPELTIAFNKHFGTAKTAGAIKSALTNHKITCGRPVGFPAGTLISYTQEQLHFIQENYLNLTIPELTREFNARFFTKRTAGHLRAFTRNHRVKSGRTGRFEKDHSSWNAGTKGLVKPNSGNFKKGSIPPNRKPLGHERICSKDGFILIKIVEKNPYTGAPTRYKHKHVYVWEQENGKVPDGFVIAFKDSNKLNCDLDNLMLLSRAELLAINQHNYKETPDELKPSVLAIAKLEVKVRKRRFA